MVQESLVEVRESWEKKQKVLLEIPIVLGDFKKLYVILEDQKKNYRLNRYFLTGSSWVVSVDVDSEDINKVYEYINQDRDLMDLKASLI